MNFMTGLYAAMVVISIVMIFIGSTLMVKMLYVVLLLLSIGLMVYYWKRKKATELPK
jgi:4-hydroxybenzoate polyprenyltransferase